jgi:phosphodiesterase/alkaline phosphatase D-like protein
MNEIAHVRKDGTQSTAFPGPRISLIFTLLALFFEWFVPELHAQAINFAGEELLGKPTNSSVTVNIVPNTTIEYYYEYGTASGVYTWQTSHSTATGGQPHEVTISALNPNTRYYYRMQYRQSGGSWVVRGEHSFWTQRARGSTFKFTITSDSHAQFNSYHQQAMTHVKADQPDFNLDLGDTFSLDGTTSQSQVNTRYLAYRDTLYLGAIGPSVPIFLSSGNHENEEGWNLDDTPFSIAVGSIQARKAYYPTPIQDGFYSGNTDPLASIDEGTYADKYREDYYAWEWGDALFVVIDPFQYTMHLSYTPVAGEGTDDAVTGDQWSWTLGAQQFNWFKQTIQNSTAKYKFVFSHQMVGGITRPIAGAGAGYVRGGAEAAAYFEWGGNNADGTPGFAAHRNAADFGTVPIHQLMVANGVTAYFHGHDHQYVYEKRDGVVYQEVPSPSLTGSGFSGIYTEGDHGSYQTIKMLPNTGYMRVTVTPEQASVEYVSYNGSVNYTYTVEAPLAITLGTFAAGANTAGSGVRLDWTTVTETNNYGFYVQRREEGGETFRDVVGGFVAGHGTTLQPQKYSYVDNTLPREGQYGYRLKQVDLDGTEHFTGAVSVQAEGKSGMEGVPVEFRVMQNYPNPFNPTTVISYQLPEVSDVRLVVFDLLGCEVGLLVHEREKAGVHEVTFDASGMASGVYLYRLQARPVRDGQARQIDGGQAGDFVQARKLLLMR